MCTVDDLIVTGHQHFQVTLNCISKGSPFDGSKRKAFEKLLTAKKKKDYLYKQRFTRLALELISLEHL